MKYATHCMTQKLCEQWAEETNRTELGLSLKKQDSPSTVLHVGLRPKAVPDPLCHRLRDKHLRHTQD